MNDKQNDPTNDNPIPFDEPVEPLNDNESEIDDTLVDDAEIESDNFVDSVEEDVDSLEDETTIADDDIQPSPSPDEMDVDAALAAVSQLTLLTEEEQADDLSLADDEFSSDDDTDDIEEDATVVEIVDEFEIPHNISMSRGQLASVLPAVTLIILGGWLTFTLTTTSTTPSAGLLFAVVLIGVGVIFLSQWLTSARWSRGNFFIGASILMIGGVQLYLSQVATNAMNSGWSLWIVAIGLALFGSGYLTLPRLPRLSIMGILTIVAGGIGYVLSSGAIAPEVVGFLGNLWIVGVVILGIMLIAPILRRRGE